MLQNPSGDILMKSVDYSHIWSTDFPGGTNCVQCVSYERTWDCCCWLSRFVLRQEVDKGSGTDDQVCANRHWKLKTNQSQRYVGSVWEEKPLLCLANPGNSSECFNQLFPCWWLTLNCKVSGFNWSIWTPWDSAGERYMNLHSRLQCHSCFAKGDKEAMEE